MWVYVYRKRKNIKNRKKEKKTKQKKLCCISFHSFVQHKDYKMRLSIEGIVWQHVPNRVSGFIECLLRSFMSYRAFRYTTAACKVAIHDKDPIVFEIIMSNSISTNTYSCTNIRWFSTFDTDCTDKIMVVALRSNIMTVDFARSVYIVFFELGNREYYLLATCICKTGSWTSEEFNKAKTNYFTKIVEVKN